MVKEGKKITGPEQLKDAAFGCARIRGDTLGIVGLGQFTLNQTIFTEEAVCAFKSDSLVKDEMKSSFFI